MRKFFNTVLLILILLVPLLILCGIGSMYNKFIGNNTKNIEYLKENFIANEKEFADLEEFFNSVFPKDKASGIWFELKGRQWYKFHYRNNFHLIIYPKVDSGKIYKEIGGFDLELGSSQLDSAIHFLGWTHETVKQLRSKLCAVNCDMLRLNDNVLRISPSNQDSWFPSVYIIEAPPILDDSIRKKHLGLSNSNLGKRTTIPPP